YFRKEMAITISGLKTGPFQHFEYDQIAQLPKESSAFHLKNESLSDY
ncbi:oxidoreductase, partial [Acinetobacter baumannii]